jgi:hypothetical protein
MPERPMCDRPDQALPERPGRCKAANAEALRFMVHFVGDLHQPLHDEDNHDKGGNTRHVIFDGRPDNLHWIWDSGLLEHINRNPQTLAAELENKITPQDRAEWTKGSVEDWVMEGHELAQTVAYGDLGSGDSAAILRRSPWLTNSKPTRRSRIIGEGRSEVGRITEWRVALNVQSSDLVVDL